ncbi:unknown [Bacteroides sp. CAG:754]|nr:unknown [Bacteroides sp. CAG:754]
MIYSTVFPPKQVIYLFDYQVNIICIQKNIKRYLLPFCDR